MELVVLIPALRRPHRVLPVLESIEAATPEPHRVLFIASAGDDAELDALDAVGAEYIVIPENRGTYACKINAGFRASVEPLLFSAADDLLFHAGWFARARALLDDTTKVVGTVDLCNQRTMRGEHSTHTLFTRSYIEQHGTIDEPGKVLHEEYRHDYVDDEFVGTAKARGVYAHAFDSVVEHLHPNAGKAEDDDVYQLGRQWSRDGRALFRRRQRLWQ